MAKEIKNRSPEKITTLTAEAPGAKDVKIAGTFTSWKLIPMAKSKDGNWSIALPLPRGRHEYKFIIDGKWCCEPEREDIRHAGCEHCVPNAFGTMNRVIEIA